jgi:hypothetical protein
MARPGHPHFQHAIFENLADHKTWLEGLSKAAQKQNAIT